MITPFERIQAVKEWNELFHPLTCGTDSNHPPLEAAATPFGVYLFCSARRCGYTQPHWKVPAVVWTSFFERHASQRKADGITPKIREEL